MSRLPFWLPPNKDVPRPLPKLVVKGYSGPPEVRQALITRFAGDIKLFYLKAAHNYSLGIVDQWEASRETDQYKLHYTNDHGRETVTIEVAAKVTSEEERKIGIPWDWAVIDFEIPAFMFSYTDPEPGAETIASNMMMCAKLITPDPLEEGAKNDPDAEWGIAVKGISGYERFSAEPERPILQWASSRFHNQVGADQDPSDNIEITSLLVDLRRWPTYEQIRVAVYGNMLDLGDDVYERWTTQFGWAYVQYNSDPADLDDGAGNPTPETLTQTTGPVPVGTPNPYTDYVDQSQEPNDGLPRDHMGDPPLQDYNDFYSLPIDNQNSHFVRVPQGLSYLIDLPGITEEQWEFHENELVYEFAPIMNTELVFDPIDSTSLSEIKATMFRGTPDWAWTDRMTSNQQLAWNQWFVETNYPNRFGMGVIARDVTIPKEDELFNPTGTDDPITGLTFLGILNFSPKSGGAWWTPAENAGII